MFLYQIQPQPQENKGILPRPAIHIGAEDKPSDEQRAAWMQQVDAYIKRKTAEEGRAWYVMTMREIAVWHEYAIGCNKCFTERVQAALYEMEALQREIGLPSIKWIEAWYKVELVREEVGLAYLAWVATRKEDEAEG